MRTAFGLTLVIAIGFSLGGAQIQLAAASGALLGQEGPLAKLVPPNHGRKACFARTYDTAHLKKHPQQQTEALLIQIQYYYPETRGPYQQPHYRYHLNAQVKGRKTMLHASGDCVHEGGRIRCGVECDGGALTLELEEARGSLKMSIDERLRMGSCGEEDIVNWGIGADDKVFRLRKVSVAACRSLDREMDP